MSKIKNKIKEGLRQFGLTTIAVDNATSVFLITLMIVIFGLRSYNSTPKESFPEISIPTVFVNTPYFGNSASDIENLVSRPIEKELAQISEITDLTSSSVQDFSLIVAEFSTDTDIDEAVRKVKDAVDKAKTELPSDLTTEPDVIDVDLSELPIMTVNLSGDFTVDELRGYAEYLEEQLEDIKEIASVDVKGIQDREMAIEVDIPKMESLEVSFNDIENAIKAENMNMSGGELVVNDFRRSIRVVGEVKSVEDLEDIIVKSENQLPVYLKDIAEVTFGFEESSSIARSDKLPVVSLDVIKEKGENLLDASDKIKSTVELAKKTELPENLKVQFFNDQSVQIRNTVSNLENGIISGVILVVLVLLFFLGLRNSMFVGMAIPLSMLLGITIVSAIGYTMNMIVLFSLILALGMLVDNAIVVVENIYRYMQNGYSGIEAAKYGTGEVAVPIIASTATTLAAFLPLAFWPSLMGEFMGYMPITLIVVLTSSLFVALVVNPVFTSRFMKVDEKQTPEVRKRKMKNNLIGVAVMFVVGVLAHFAGVMWLRNILGIVIVVTLLNIFFLRSASFYFQEKLLPLLEWIYDRFIRFALKGINPTLTFVGTFLLLIFSFVLLGVFPPKVELFPTTDPLYVNAFIELPEGTDIDATDELVQDIESKIEGVIGPYYSIVEAMLTQIGENTSDPNDMPTFSATPHKARLTVAFVPDQDRNGISTVEVMENIREALKGYAGVQIIVDQNQNGPPTGKPINIELQGNNIDRLATLSGEVIAYLNSKNVPGVEELKADVKIGKPELLVHIDRESASRYGVSTFAIANVIRTAVFGKEISKFKLGEDDYPIQLRVSEKYRNNIDQILNQKITFRSPSTGQISQVPISAVANVSYSSSYNSINRKDQERLITVYSNVLADANANEVVAELREYMDEYDMPEGFSYEFTGEQEEMAEEMEFLSGALIAAIFGIFLIIVAQFNSIISPFIILLSVLFSTIGVFLGYITSGMNIGIIMTGVGIISLAGIVVNNAIVLIDYINLVIKRKVQELNLESEFDLSKEDVKEAIVNGGATRLRPVLLTAITTVLGLIPLAIGFNFNFFTFVTDLDPQYFVGGDNAVFWGTMAWTVIYGLVFATFLTLVVVPAMYWLAYRLKLGVRRTFNGRKRVKA
ncbi:MAG: AcrB/AcrD/AcrF family protein [Bacteroidetes bacterium]|nr:MAG: AcrB/AcrD/AcrF family protein [Bacteroidota bacterium]